MDNKALLFLVYALCIDMTFACAVPQLLIEKNEGKSLSERHVRIVNWLNIPGNEGVVLLPKNNDNFLYTYDRYLADGKSDSFFIGMVVEIKGELRARLNDENLVYIDNYLNVMRKSFSMFKSHEDQQFSFDFYNKLAFEFCHWIGGVEKDIKKSPSKFKSENLIRIVKSVSDMLEDAGYFDAINDITLFESYKQLHLTGEYWQSEEGQNMINAVTGALLEGFSLK